MDDVFLEHKKVWLILLLLIIISPIFGVFLADLVGYHEPLDVAAEKLGLNDTSESFNWTPFFDYSVPGLPAWIGYIMAGFIGVLVIVALGALVSWVKRRE
ncbi:MAG: PDGLE domain-containing protein [Candidatus Njordarchaeia archaeon]